MKRFLRFELCVVLFLACANRLAAQDAASTFVFSEPGFPTADTAAISPEQIQKLLPSAQLLSTEKLNSELASKDMKLLVLAYGSAFPESAWGDMLAFLRRGGNLLVIGGRPFTRSAYKDDKGWHLRNYSVRFSRQLQIDQYQTAPGSEGLEFHSSADVPIAIPTFGWKRSFSPVIR